MYKTRIKLLLLVACITFTFAKNETQTNDGNTESSSAGIQSALAPLYKMTNGFVEAVFGGPDKDNLILNIVTGVLGGKQPDIPATAQKALKLTGFAACIVIGGLLLIVMPLTGCFCCCCRLCGNCGGKAPENDPKHAKAKRLIFGALMLIFTLVTLGGMVMIFFVGADLNDLLANGKLARELQAANSDLKGTARSTTDEITDKVKYWSNNNNMTETIDNFFEDMSSNITDQLLSSGSTTNVKDKASQLIGAIGDLNSTVSDFYTTLKKHRDLLESAGQNLSNTVPLLSGSGFEAFVTNISAALTRYDFNPVLTETAVNQKKFNDIPNFEVLYDQAISNVTDYINNGLSTVRSDVKSKFPNISEIVDPALDSVENSLDEIFGTVTDTLGEVSNTINSDPLVKDIGKYGNIGVSVMGAIVAVIVLFLLIGIACGFGGRPSDSSCSFGCNRGAGANCLLAAVGFMFIFFALLMLFTIVFFTIGSLTSSQVCWTVQEPEKYPIDLKPVNMSGNTNNQIPIYEYLEIYRGCLAGKTIGEAANSILSDKLQGVNKQIEDELKKLDLDALVNSFNIDTTQFDVLPTSLNNTLTELSQFDNSVNNEQDIIDILQINPITQSLPAIITNLNGRPNFKPARDQLVYAVDVTGPALTQSAKSVINALQSYTSTNESQPAELLKTAAGELLKAIGDAKRKIEVDTNTVLNQTKQSVVKSAETLVRNVGEEPVDLATSVKCQQLGKSVQKVVNVVCETSLNPLNGLWFSLGWCLIFFIPNIITALYLSSLYRRLYSYEKNYDHELPLMPKEHRGNSKNLSRNRVAPQT